MHSPIVPAQRRERPEGGREPRIEDGLVAAQSNARPRLALRLFLGFGDDDAAVVGIPRRNPVATPQSARDTPRLDVFHPVEEGLFPCIDRKSTGLNSSN